MEYILPASLIIVFALCVWCILAIGKREVPKR
jgi:hypothetical protein